VRGYVQVGGAFHFGVEVVVVGTDPCCSLSVAAFRV